MAKRNVARTALDMAKPSLQTGVQILRHALAHGLIERNPGAGVRPSDALRPLGKENCARLEAHDMPELPSKLEACQGSVCTRLAMKSPAPPMPYWLRSSAWTMAVAGRARGFAALRQKSFTNRANHTGGSNSGSPIRSGVRWLPLTTTRPTLPNGGH
jgi:hypothetical protein